MSSLFGQSNFIRIHQIKELMEIAIGWEGANKYEILDESGAQIGFAAEQRKGIFSTIVRNILKYRRPITLRVWDRDKNLVYTAKRPFFFFFSDMKVQDASGKLVGDIKTRFGVLKRKYDLVNSNGVVTARIESPRWRLWTFFISDRSGASAGEISKKWGGALKEVFSDTDNFALDLSKRQWADDEKTLLLFATMSIDLDFFEENSSSVLSLFD